MIMFLTILRGFTIALIAATLLTAVIVIRQVIHSSYEYENSIYSFWSLADKSSTIPAKSQYIDQFVLALDQQGFAGRYDATIYPTPDNSFDANFTALKTLQSRLHEISTMNPASFEYQTAIQQITAQEQGEAKPMLDTFEGVWYLEHYPLLWNWHGVLLILALLSTTVVVPILWIASSDDF